MLIKLSPTRSDAQLVVSKQGDALTVNGQTFDFTPLTEGATLPAEAIGSGHFCGPVERINGEIHCTLLFPHGPNPSQVTAFPAPVVVTEDGPVPLPTEPEAEE